jgi:hypothetical protein
MNLVMTTLVAHEYLWMCIIETSSVIVSIYCECPSTSLPSHGAIEVVQCYTLVILPRSQHEAEVCIATIPPSAKHVTISVGFAHLHHDSAIFEQARRPSLKGGFS